MNRDLIATGLGILDTPEVTTRSTLLATGHKMLIALERAADTDHWLPESALFGLVAGKLTRLGLLERSEKRVGNYYCYRATDAGLRFLGRRAVGMHECQPGWVRFHALGGTVDVNLADIDHRPILTMYAKQIK